MQADAKACRARLHFNSGELYTLNHGAFKCRNEGRVGCRNPGSRLCRFALRR
jgi:hypothetical protein